MTVASAVDGIEIGDHVVQFDQREPDLVVAVGGYLSAAVCAGEVAIVIATPAHRAAFEAELVAAGVDAAAARGAGRYLELDAAETLALFSGGGSVDREAYFAVVGALVRQAVATGAAGAGLRGDGGAALAGRGRARRNRARGAVERTGPQVAFSLYCAYPKASVSQAQQAQALENVCHLHSSVIGSIDARTPPQTMQAAVNLPAQQRRRVQRAGSSWPPCKLGP